MEEFVALVDQRRVVCDMAVVVAELDVIIIGAREGGNYDLVDIGVCWRVMLERVLYDSFGLCVVDFLPFVEVIFVDLVAVGEITVEIELGAKGSGGFADAFGEAPHGDFLDEFLVDGNPRGFGNYDAVLVVGLDDEVGVTDKKALADDAGKEENGRQEAGDEEIDAGFFEFWAFEQEFEPLFADGVDDEGDDVDYERGEVGKNENDFAKVAVDFEIVGEEKVGDDVCDVGADERSVFGAEVFGFVFDDEAKQRNGEQGADDADK